MEKLGSDRSGFFHGLRKLNELYAGIDSAVSALRRATGLSCLPRCGSCCEAPSGNIEVSAFELMPLALELWRRGEAERALDAALKADDLQH